MKPPTFVHPMLHPESHNKVLCDFSMPTPVGVQIVNDGVMGGVSRSQFTISSRGTGMFRGEVSLENNGGFASVRLVPALRSLTDESSFRLRVRGDGHRYKFLVRLAGSPDGVNYRCAFNCKAGIWEEPVLPFASFEPTWRGRILSDQPALDPRGMDTVGFLISDGQAGPFQLEVAWIKAGQHL